MDIKTASLKELLEELMSLEEPNAYIHAAIEEKCRKLVRYLLELESVADGEAWPYFVIDESRKEFGVESADLEGWS